MSNDSFKVKNSINIAPKAVATTQAGDVRAASDDGNKLKYHNGTSEKTVQTSANNLTASKAVATDSSGDVVSSTTTATELGYVAGVTSAIQTQIDSKQATGNYITALSGDVVASGPGSASATIQAGAVTNGKLASSAVDNSKVSASAAIAYSKLNLSASIVNADVSASAAIAYSKLNLGTSIVNADISTSAAIAYSKLNLTGNIVNADVSASAAIARSKIAAGSNSHVIVNDGSGNLSSSAQLPAGNFPALTGDVTTSAGALATTLATVNSNVGTFGSSSLVPTITVNAKGLVTAVTTNAVTATSAWNIVSKSATYTAVANDYIYASGSAFTITLPTAVGVSGQQIAIEHAGSHFTAYTLNTTSSQTIGGIASGVFTLTTAGEFLRVTSDGSNWRISGRKTSTGRVSYTPSWGTGLGTPGSVNFFWERDREHIVITGSATAGTVAGSAASISGPSGATPAASISAKICGEWHRDQAAAEYGTMLVTASTAAIAMGVAAGAANPFTAANGNGILASTQLFNVHMRYPVTGWQP